jgi:hypothetical protein
MNNWCRTSAWPPPQKGGLNYISCLPLSRFNMFQWCQTWSTKTALQNTSTVSRSWQERNGKKKKQTKSLDIWKLPFQLTAGSGPQKDLPPEALGFRWYRLACAGGGVTLCHTWKGSCLCSVCCGIWHSQILTRPRQSRVASRVGGLRWLVVLDVIFL